MNVFTLEHRILSVFELINSLVVAERIYCTDIYLCTTLINSRRYFSHGGHRCQTLPVTLGAG